jgi:hypothetical protein
MPFGKKIDNGGMFINFDSIYNNLIVPAIEEAGLKPIRADEEKVGGIIHKPMFERLILCEYAVVDLTTANPNVFYELGVRHAVRPYSTVLLYAEGTKQLPFDISPLSAFSYKLDSSGNPDQQYNKEVKGILKRRLIEAQNPKTDSPIFQLVEGFPDIQHIKTDVFRERVNYSEELKKQLARIRREKDITNLRNFVLSLKNIKNQEAGVIIDTFLSYRAIANKKEDWEEMAEFVTLMPEPLLSTTLVQEQYAFALNRAGHSEEAERILLSLIEKKGPSSETNGILGRVYKDRWEKTYNTEKNKNVDDGDDPNLSALYLDQAIDAYLKGFETDWRDTYPGINAITLMEIKKKPDPRRIELIPVVKYSVERKIAKGKPDYWDYATLLELAILAKDEKASFSYLSMALSHLRERWEGETTLRNLRTIREAREKRNELVPWAKKIEGLIQKRLS